MHSFHFMKRLFKFKYYITVFASFIFVISVQNCERDDICAETTATTPRLSVEFYDALELEDLKNVPRLTAYGEGLVLDENGEEIEPTTSSDATIVFNTNVNAALLPLKIENDDESFITARYVLEKDTNLRLNDSGEDDSNKDIIEIRYQTEFVYVSRACGYKSIFKNLLVTLITDEDNWISSVEVPEAIEGIVENENTVHVRINH